KQLVVSWEMTHNVKALAMLGLQSSFRPNKSTVNEQKEQIMIHRTIENLSPEPKLISEQKAENKYVCPSTANAMLPAVHSSETYLMDCIEGMKHYPDKWFDLAVVDVPYGLGMGVETSA